MSLKERLKLARSAKGISQKDLAAKIGRNQSAIAALESGRNKESTNIATIAKVLDVDPVWLETGIGNMKIQKDCIAGSLDDAGISGFVQFKRVDLKATMGVGELNNYVQDEVHSIEVSKSWAFKNIGNISNHIAIMTATDNSMAPTIETGDLLFVNLSCKCHKEDGIYIIDTPKGWKIRRLQTMINGDLQIISDNKKYVTELIPMSKRKTINIFAKVQAAWSHQTL